MCGWSGIARLAEQWRAGKGTRQGYTSSSWLRVIQYVYRMALENTSARELEFRWRLLALIAIR